tara:strand:+ start:425 stop:838 length:414 start_codon:yes stop_codon:yes gene_type:complete
MINLKKLAVGINSLEELKDFQILKLKKNNEIFVKTKNTPKRKPEILDGGSLYWIIKNRFAIRQLVIDIRENISYEGKKYCLIILDRKIIQVEKISQRPFQGWRYLKLNNSPKDINLNLRKKIPEELSNHLSEIGFKN